MLLFLSYPKNIWEAIYVNGKFTASEYILIVESYF